MNQKRILFAVVLSVSLAGCSAISPDATTDTAPEPKLSDFEDSELNYTLSTDCVTHLSDTPIRCNADLDIETMGDGISGVQWAVRTDSHNVTEMITHDDVKPLFEAYTGRLGEVDEHLQYGDRIVVRAIMNDGTAVTVESHELSCEDSVFVDACNESATAGKEDQ